jgi:hypothetical protein
MKNTIVRVSVFSIAACATFSMGAQKVAAGSDRDGRHGSSFVCSARTLKGMYGVQMQGSRPLPGGGTEQVIGIVTRTYDGAGRFTQVDNIKGATTGIVPNRPGSGTYVVNADCTGSTLFQPGPGVSIEEHMVIVDYGYEVRSITVSPAANMVTTIGKRIGLR